MARVGNGLSVGGVGVGSLESAAGGLPAHMLVDGVEWIDFEKG
jgi:hypothetical protein